MTQRRCQVCAYFYDKKLPECPECQTPGYGVNPHFYRTKLDNHLTGQVQGQRNELQRYKQLKES